MKRAGLAVLLNLIVISVLMGSLQPLPQTDARTVSLDHRWISLSSVKNGLNGLDLVAYEGIVYQLPEGEKTSITMGQIIYSSEKEIDAVHSALEQMVAIGYLALSESDMKETDRVLASVHGVVYDLTDLNLWSIGTHMGQHRQGEELTFQILRRAPHTDQLLERARPVAFLGYHPGELETKKTRAAVYVSAFGKIYDLTQSARWSAGTHLGRHSGGEELTFDLVRNAPHPISRLDRGYLVGLFVFTRTEAEQWAQRNSHVQIRQTHLIDIRIDQTIGVVLE